MHIDVLIHLSSAHAVFPTSKNSKSWLEKHQNPYPAPLDSSNFKSYLKVRASLVHIIALSHFVNALSL